MKRVLVTGASGFVGINCLPLLMARGYEVHAADIVSAPPGAAVAGWHVLDLLDPAMVSDMLASVRPTHLLHLAWYVDQNKYWTSPANLHWTRASLHLLEQFATRGGTRILCAGSCAEYGLNADGICREDSSPITPGTLYGACKHALHMIASAYAAQVGLSLAWARIFFLYGPREKPQRLVPSTVRSLLAGEKAVCRHGNYERDFLHVLDAADALVAVLESGATGPVNVAYGLATSIGRVVRCIADLLNRQDLLEIREEPAEPSDQVRILADTTRLRNDVGWSPKYDLQNGLEETVQWWRDHPAQRET